MLSLFKLSKLYQISIKLGCRSGLFFLIIATAPACKKLVEPNVPKASLSEANIYNTDVAAISVLNGLYYQIVSNNYFAGNNGISLFAGLSADEFKLSNAVSSTDVKNYAYIDSLFSNSSGTKSPPYWSNLYSLIFRCNAAIEGLNGSDKLTIAVKQQLLGEAVLIRALSYFYLVNLYGDVALVTSTDWQASAQMARTPKVQVYQQIINDLKESQGLLSDKYLDANLQPYTGTAERVRPTKWASTALLARVYLYNGNITNDATNFANAETQATAVINNASLYSLPTLNNVFLKNSVETIFQLQPVSSGQNTFDGAMFLLPSTGPDGFQRPVSLSSQLLGSFEPGDNRRYGRNWIDSIIVGSTIYYFPYKYKEGSNGSITTVSLLKEYLMVLRLGEQYLIRAEARVRQGNIGGAQNDLNAIRTRAGLANTTADTQPTLLTAILHERQVELFSEIGHRWFDLKRTGNVDAVMSVVRPQKAGGKPWQTWMQLYPVPFDDIQKNGNLTQNPGYQ